jgi:transcription elongation factor Elf1
VTTVKRFDLGNEVRPEFACPNCGEREADRLVNSSEGDGTVFCESCRATYALDLEGPARQAFGGQNQ